MIVKAQTVKVLLFRQGPNGDNSLYSV